jgi:HD-GYP domain-containing protein (c-di-GMP phosphodiesterase class II)
MHAAPGFGVRTAHLAEMIVATLAVAVLPGLVAGGLQAAGVIGSWWLSVVVAMLLSLTAAAVGSAWWTRRRSSPDVVFADLMAWGWLRRLRAERRVASTSWLLGGAGRFEPDFQAALLERLSIALETGNPHVHGHTKRVARHAHMIAEGLGLPPSEVARIRAAASVHDVGKLEIPQEVLNKPGALTDEEFETIKRHASRGAEMVAVLGDDELTAIVRHHHERLDGGGYPDGLRGDEIPLGARVIAVADTFDAVTSSRPYRAARSHKEALDVLRDEAGTQLDPYAVGAFLDYYSGQRGRPWLAVLAAAPSRLAVWALSGVGSAAAAPLAGGAAALGTTLLVGAAVTGAPSVRDDPPPSKPAAVSAIAVTDKASQRAVRVTKDPRGGSPGHRQTAGERGNGRTSDSDTTPSDPPGDRVATGAPTSAPGGGATGGNGSTAGGGSTSSGGSGSSGGLDATKVLELPDVPSIPALPQVEAPDLPLPLPLPQTQLPPVRLP